MYRGGQNGTDHSLYIKTTHSTIDELKVWFAEQYAKGTPVTIQYILATPIIHDLTPEQIKAYKALRTNHPTTIITNDCDAYMDVKYNVDLEIKMEDDAAEERYESDLKYGGAIVQTIQGETLVATDSAKAPFLGMKLFGKTEQVQTNGYQLFDSSKIATKSKGGCTVTNNGDGSFTISSSGELTGTFAAAYSLSHEQTVRLFKTGNVYCKWEANRYPYLYVEFIANEQSLGAVRYMSEMFTVTQDFLDNVTSYVRFGFYGEFDKQSLIPGTIKPMFYQEGDGTWEPFSQGYASPSPDYPQELKSAGQASGQIESVVYGKNLLNDAYKKVTTNNIQYNQTGNPPIRLKGGVTYTLTCFSSVKPSGLYLGNYNDGSYLKNTYTSNTLTYTAETDIDACVNAYWSAGDGNVPSDAELMLEVGDKSTDYEPYKQPQSLITKTPNGLPGIPLGATISNKIQNSPIHMDCVWWCEEEEQYYISDTVDYENGKYVEIISKAIPNTTNGYSWNVINVDGYNVFYCYIDKMINGSRLLCDKYISIQGGVHTPYGDKHITTDMGSGYYIWIQDASYNGDVNAFSTAMNENPITVQYALATPIIRDLTKEELKAFKELRSNYPTTTIMNDANVHMEASYVVDTKTYIDKKFAELAARLSQ